MSRFSIVLGDKVSRHRAVFLELVESLSWGLQSLGHEVQSALLPGVHHGARDIILAPHLLLGERLDLAPGTIVYNAEPFCSPNFVQSLKLLARPEVQVWDYWRRTTEFLLALGIPAKTVPFAWCPSFSRRRSPAPSSTRDIDVVFVGSISPRRAKVLEDLAAHGPSIRTAVLFGVYGAERDAMLCRAKVCLNMHYWEEGGCEDLRILLAASNAVAVVSEGEPDEPYKAQWAKWTSYPALAAECVYQVQSGSWLHQGALGCASVQMRDAASVLRQVL